MLKSVYKLMIKKEMKMSEQTKGVQDLFFPNENFRENAQFPNVLDLVGKLDFEGAKNELDKLDEEKKQEYRVLRAVINSFIKEEKLDFNELMKEDFSIYKNLAELGFYFQEMLANDKIGEPEVRVYAQLLQEFSIVCFPKIQEEAKGYPNNSVSGGTWLDGACVDIWNDLLADYFDLQTDYKSLYNSRIIQSRMVFAIKNHYPYEIARSTFNVGVANEKLGQIKIANDCFNAVISDFIMILDETADSFVGNAESLYEFYYLEQALLHYYELNDKPENIKSDLDRLEKLKMEIERKLNEQKQD